MINIFICEDAEKEREFITNFIANYIMIENLDMKVVKSTGNPYEVLDYVKENPSMGLYFLDVDLKAEITGIDLAVKIREYDPVGQIVFVTSHAELMSMTFEYAVGALGYVVKVNNDTMKRKISEYVTVVAERFLNGGHEDGQFTFRVDGKVISEKYADIMFFEIAGKRSGKVMMYGRTRQEEFRGNLSDIEAVTDKFMRCSRSVLINVDNVKTLDGIARVVHMANGDTCEVSRSGMRELKRILE